jgi:hypothetical protein
MMQLLQTEKSLLAAWRDLLLAVARYGQTAAIGVVLVLATPWVFAGHDAAAEQRGNCATHGITVLYEGASELNAACKALSDVVGYFGQIGFQVPAKFSVHFADRGGDGSKGHSPAHGLFDPLRSQIVIYRASEAKPWGQAWSPLLAGSFLRHEIGHTAIWEAVKANPKQLRPEWHEFIAYAVQLDLMDAGLRQQVLAAHADASPVKDLSEINEFSYGMNPEAFAVVAYKTYLERGAAAFVRQVLKSEIMPPPMSYPFAVLPHEVRQ